MNICLYGASSSDIDEIFIIKTEELGEKLARAGHNLVYGGGAGGLMGAAARGIINGGGEVIGVAPTFFQVDGVLFPDCTDFIFTETMRERKRIMEEKADGFVAVPGGIGTFDELFEIISLKQLGRHNKPVAVYNINGYFNAFINMLDTAVKGGFMTEKSRELVVSVTSPEELIKYFDEYKGDVFDFSVLRKVKKD